jgi:alpha-tubulin suppressor-like RCC1 family protein
MSQMTSRGAGVRATRAQWPAIGRVAAGATAASLAAVLVLCGLAGPASASPVARGSVASARAGASTATPTAAPASRARRAAATSGTLRGWGNNILGELGDGTSTNRDAPVKVRLPRGTKITSVRAGCLHTVALTSTGQVLAWGLNLSGQLGDGKTADARTPVKVRLPRHTKITAVRAGCDFGLALTSKGQVLAWGLGVVGQLGDGNHANRRRPVLVKLPKGVKAKAITAGYEDALAISTTGRLYSWGYDSNGQLGDGQAVNRDRPVRVKLPKGTKIKIVSAGGNHGLALSTTGQLYAWGYNGFGQLGDGTTTDQLTPEPINFEFRGHPIGKITSLVAGCNHSLALTSHGVVLAWGYNGFGQLGNASTTSTVTAVGADLPAGVHVRAISAGCNDSLARTAGGHVLAWGYNGDGELGDGTLGDSDVPVSVHLPAGLDAIGIGSGPDASNAFAIVRPAG